MTLGLDVTCYYLPLENVDVTIMKKYTEIYMN